MNEHLDTSLRLTLICFIAVLLLSIVYLLTNNRIKEAEKNSLNQANKELFPEGEQFIKKNFPTGLTKNDNTDYYFEVINKDSKLIGYITSIAGTGFGGEIILLIAFNKKASIMNMKLMKNAETPGFGKKWEKQTSMDMFVKTNTNEKPFPSKKNMLSAEFLDTPHGVTGATITFNGIVKAATQAIKLVEEIK